MFPTLFLVDAKCANAAFVQSACMRQITNWAENIFRQIWEHQQRQEHLLRMATRVSSELASYHSKCEQLQVQMRSTEPAAQISPLFNAQSQKRNSRSPLDALPHDLFICLQTQSDSLIQLLQSHLPFKAGWSRFKT